MVHHLLGIWCNGNTTDFDSVILGSSPSIPAIGIIMNIFKEFHYREVTETLREIMDGPYKGYALSNKGALYDKDNKIVPLNQTKHHPTRYIAQEGYTITLWRLMCYIWLDDLTDFEADTTEQKYIYNYQLTKKFWTKYAYLIPNVCKNTESFYIPLPRLMGFNLKTGKITRMKIKDRSVFNLGDLSLPTIVADFKALMSNKRTEEHKDDTVKIDNVVELATRYKNLSTENKDLLEQIAYLTTKQENLTQELAEIKENLTSILK